MEKFIIGFSCFQLLSSSEMSPLFAYLVDFPSISIMPNILLVFFIISCNSITRFIIWEAKKFLMNFFWWLNASSIRILSLDFEVKWRKVYNKIIRSFSSKIGWFAEKKLLLSHFYSYFSEDFLLANWGKKFAQIVLISIKLLYGFF